MREIDLLEPINIAGLCSVKTEEQFMASAREAQRRGLILRTGLYKPRTGPAINPKDFFDGPYQPEKEGGKDCLRWLATACDMGVTPALEVNGPNMAYDVLNVLQKEAHRPRVLLWIGSRMQEHRDQISIAKLAAETSWAMLMIKNQPWESEDHWRGIIGYVADKGYGGYGRERLLVCHRGFQPNKYAPNPLGLRNLPDWEMAMKIKEEMGVKMLADTSHMGGTKKNVLIMTEEALAYERLGKRIDGFVLEVGDGQIETDEKQHLSWNEYDKLDLTRRMHLVAA